MRRFLLILIVAFCSISSFAQNQYEYYDMEGNYHTQWFPGSFNIKYYDQDVTWREHPGAKFNIYLNPLGMVAGVDWGGPSVEAVVGVRFNKYFFLGAETGFDSFGRQDQLEGSYRVKHEAFVPVALNAKGLLPYGKRCCPFVEGSLGGYLGVLDLHSNGLYVKSGLGFEFNRLVISAGYTGLHVNGYFRNLGYLRFGFRIGR
ncbi:MAG: hypothetical protein MJY97_10590 [Bacteroidales bacterium]|nr:hypothetical protein [Bacteroidales bacterium]